MSAYVDPLNGECEDDVSHCPDCGSVTDWHQGPSERHDRYLQHRERDTAIELGDAMIRYHMLTIQRDEHPERGIEWAVWSSEDVGFGPTLLDAVRNLRAVQS